MALWPRQDNCVDQSEYSLTRTRDRSQLVYRLGKADSRAARRLSRLLSKCGSDECGSAACPVCCGHHQAAASSLVDVFIQQPASALRGRCTLVTVVPSIGIADPRTLTAQHFAEVRKALASALAAVGYGPAVFGIEASFVEDATGRFANHWSVHAHGIALDWPSEELERNLRAWFPPSGPILKPVDFERLDGRVNAALYVFKAERFRRDVRLSTATDKRAPHRKGIPRPLRPEQAVELALVDHEVGFRDRLLTHGIDEDHVSACLKALNWPRDGP